MKITIKEDAKRRMPVNNPSIKPQTERLIADLSNKQRTIEAEFRQFSSRIIGRRIVSVIS
jgi:hypothetical protein